MIQFIVVLEKKGWWLISCPQVTVALIVKYYHINLGAIFHTINLIHPGRAGVKKMPTRRFLDI